MTDANEGHRKALEEMRKITGNLPSKGFIIFWMGIVPTVAIGSAVLFLA